MRALSACLACLLLLACNTPSPGFRGIDPVRVTVDGSVFAVRVAGNAAEAIRINPQYAPRMGPIGDRARVAIERVSGCSVARLGGDQAMIRARLSCGRAAPGAPLSGPEGWTCVALPPRGGEVELVCSNT